MSYHPSKEHLDHQIPKAFKSINAVLKDLKRETGADDRYVALMLDALSKEWAPQTLSHDEFGFR